MVKPAYRFCRHPLYYNQLGFVGIKFGFALIGSSDVIAIAFIEVRPDLLGHHLSLIKSPDR